MRAVAISGLLAATLIVHLVAGVAVGCLAGGWWLGERVWEARTRK